MSTDCPRCGESDSTNLPACPVCGHLHATRSCDQHPERPAIAQCALCETAVCRACAAESGRTYLCPDHANVPVVEGWAQIYTTANDVEAGLIRDNLKAEGIEARVLSQKDHALTVDLGELSPVRVLVPSFAYGEALGLVRSRLDLEGDVHFACAVCGEAYDAGEQACSTCGAPLHGGTARD